MRHRGTFIVTVGALVAATSVALAAAGGFDTAFGVLGIVREPASGALANAWTTAVQSDGSILVGGSDQNDFRVRRYLANGADDAGFGAGGVVSLFDTNGAGTAHPTVYDLTVDGYGRIVCVGVGSVATLPRATVVRLLPGGALDASFGTGGVVHFDDALSAAAGTGARAARVVSLTGVALQGDGKVVVAGRVTLTVGKKSSPTYQYAIFLARLHSTGVLDDSFGVGGLVVHDRTAQDDVVQLDAVGIQSDGRIVVGSARVSYTLADLAAGKAWAITRYQANGAVDTAFGSVLGANRNLVGLAVDPSDRILVSGSQRFALNGTGDVVVARYLPGGTLDSMFGSGGSCVFGPNAYDNPTSTPVVQADGRVAVAVMLRPSTVAVPHVVRLTSGGQLDVSFGSGGISDPMQVGDVENVARSVSVASDGDLVVSGRTSFDNGAAANTHEWLVARFQGN